ncbi:MAG: LytTR family transcriptional regulator [Lachnospiraceae bacterium]
MRIRIEIEENLTEDEVVIRCSSLNESIIAIQKNIAEAVRGRQQIMVMKGDKEYWLLLTEILFLETTENQVAVHSANQVFYTRLKLYELEELLPSVFMRVSKSAIVNTEKVRSIKKNITGASEVEFENCHKIAYVSRSYLKPFISRMEERQLKQLK